MGSSGRQISSVKEAAMPLGVRNITLRALGMAQYVDPNVAPKDWEALGIDAEEAENILRKHSKMQSWLCGLR